MSKKYFSHFREALGFGDDKETGPVKGNRGKLFSHIPRPESRYDKSKRETAQKRAQEGLEMAQSFAQEVYNRQQDNAESRAQEQEDFDGARQEAERQFRRPSFNKSAPKPTGYAGVVDELERKPIKFGQRDLLAMLHSHPERGYDFEDVLDPELGDAELTDEQLNQRNTLGNLFRRHGLQLHDVGSGIRDEYNEKHGEMQKLRLGHAMREEKAELEKYQEDLRNAAFFALASNLLPGHRARTGVDFRDDDDLDSTYMGEAKGRDFLKALLLGDFPSLDSSRESRFEPTTLDFYLKPGLQVLGDMVNKPSIPSFGQLYDMYAHHAIANRIRGNEHWERTPEGKYEPTGRYMGGSDHPADMLDPYGEENERLAEKVRNDMDTAHMMYGTTHPSELPADASVPIAREATPISEYGDGDEDIEFLYNREDPSGSPPSFWSPGYGQHSSVPSSLEDQFFSDDLFPAIREMYRKHFNEKFPITLDEGDDLEELVDQYVRGGGY